MWKKRMNGMSEYKVERGRKVVKEGVMVRTGG
jgi:hypothetical protein